LADTSLQSTTSTLSRIRQLAVQFASDTNGAAERAAGAHEVRALLQHLLQLGNAEFDENQPVFGGTSRHGFAEGLAVSIPVTLTNAVADTLTVRIDGVTSGLIDLTSGTETLSGSEVAARVQSRINTDSTLLAAGKSVSVTYENARLVIASNSEGIKRESGGDWWICTYAARIQRGQCRRWCRDVRTHRGHAGSFGQHRRSNHLSGASAYCERRVVRQLCRPIY
jgi:flagellin-like hook-associated protein FlgL